MIGSEEPMRLGTLGSLGGFKQLSQYRGWELHLKATRNRWGFSRSGCDDEKYFIESEMTRHFTLNLLCGMLVFSWNGADCLV